MVRITIVRLGANALLVACGGFVELSSQTQRIAEVAVTDSFFRFDVEGLAIRVDRGVQVLVTPVGMGNLGVGIGELAAGRYIILLDFDHLLETPDRPLVVALEVTEQSTKRAVGDGVPRRKCDGSTKIGDGCVQLPRGPQSNAAIEQ